MLLLLQAAHAAAAPVHVIVDTVPSSGEWPEWVKFLISAGVGAVVGIGSSILMEFVKPVIGKRVSRKDIAKHIDDEFLMNLRRVRTIGTMCEKSRGKSKEEIPPQYVIETVMAEMVSDRHEEFFQNEKAIVYEIDPKGYLRRFYSTAKSNMAAALTTGDIEFLRMVCIRVYLAGQLYMNIRGLSDPGVDQSWIDIYEKWFDEYGERVDADAS
jgi:hypothetical protein